MECGLCKKKEALIVKMELYKEGVSLMLELFQTLVLYVKNVYLK